MVPHVLDDEAEPLLGRTQAAGLVQAVDEGAEDGGVGAEELGVLLVEVARLGGVHLE